ncbi:MAG: succinate dehydrogenase [Acidobacteriota bacterium]|nr:MAG: succinate dehydrogenase [Acidobacteriota bacterium]
MLDVRGHPNRLGLWGWLGGGRWGTDRYLYTLHRLTGLGLLGYFVLHIIVTSSRAFGQQAWEQAMARVSGPLFLIGEYLVFIAFAFHAINGIRLVLIELGIGVGKPIEPVYPYRTSLDVQRPLAVGAVLLAAVLAVVGGLDFFVWH